ncbi:hypothetical protein H5410_042902 [Solanum commersonii]|uniref:Uncharacterized protein n=1 Tax=Solanum commersonii TaxID=4109 RepID=A0A9J5XZ12_SOLCO|nr:hypothetical protein H5410_042902 [Solanum commersonii]
MSKECQWIFKSSCLNKTTLFRVRCFNNEHTCPLKDKHTPKDIQEDVKRELGVDINYMKAWHSKERAI